MSASSEPVGVGLIGAGNISRRYVRGMARYSELRLVGVAARTLDRAAELADEAHIRAYASVDQLLADPSVRVVVNITPPRVHSQFTLAALEAGKHVYVEKPIAGSLEEAALDIRVAAERGLLLGAAPDTFLGSAHQTARRAIDDGLIGTVIGVTASVPHTHIERWHPDPTAFFQPGGGPILDMGPYYLTSLVALLGTIERVAGMTRIGATPRIVTSPGSRVDRIDVTTTTHAGALLKFASGVLGTIQLSFDVWNTDTPRIEIYGSDGTLQLPDPNQMDGDVRVRANDSDRWMTLPAVVAPFAQVGSEDQYLRGPGVADLARALDGGPLRANAPLAFHVLEVLDAVQRSADRSDFVSISSSVERPAAMV